MMGERLYRKSRWLHKWIGLLLILFLIWMSASGILLNHPELIAGITVPGWLVPPQYHIVNWDRSALIDLVFMPDDPDIAIAAGKEGVWRSSDGARTFAPMVDGLPLSRFYRKTNDLLLAAGGKLLFAGTDGGLYACDPRVGEWKQVRLGGDIEPVRKVLATGDNYLVFTDSRAFRSSFSAPLSFHNVKLPRAEEKRTVTLVKLFFDLHGGKIWGPAGKLLFDAVGLTLIFLSVSAFYLWYSPLRRRKRKAENGGKSYRWFFKYHLRIGIIVAAVLLVMGVTGFFMRPPFLALIADGSIDASLYPGPLDDNPWEKSIHNALYDHVEDKIMIEAADGVWAAPASLERPFERIELGAPVFVMGTTVFEAYGDGGYLVGSFNGIYHRERGGGTIDLLTGKLAGSVSSVRPADVMVTGWFRTPEGGEFITAHEQGLMPLGDADVGGRFAMPAEMSEDFGMPLWNYVFELHNGRMFRDLIGDWYLLLVPLGALLFVLLIVTGIYDWFCLRGRKRSTG